MMYIDEDGLFVIDGERYDNVNQAYRAFRKSYNKFVGRVASRKIGAKVRKTVISHRGIDFEKEYSERLRQEFEGTGKVRCYVLGILGLSYVYIFDEPESTTALFDYDDDRRERYVDWLLSAGTTGVRMCGRMNRLVVKNGSGGYVSNKLRRFNTKHTKKKI